MFGFQERVFRVTWYGFLSGYLFGVGYASWICTFTLCLNSEILQPIFVIFFSYTFQHLYAFVGHVYEIT